MDINGTEYTTEQVREKIRMMLPSDADWKRGIRVDRDLTAEEFSFVVAAMAHHPEAAKKIKSGIRKIMIRTNARIRNKSLTGHGFQIYYVDTNEPTAEFSHGRIGERPDEADLNARTAVHDAFWLPVRQQLAEFKDRFFAEHGEGKAPCPILGTPLHTVDSHVHHAARTFIQILDDFLKPRGKTFYGMAYNREQPEDAMVEEWIAFHGGVVSHPGALEVLSEEGHKKHHGK